MKQLVRGFNLLKRTVGMGGGVIALLWAVGCAQPKPETSTAQTVVTPTAQVALVKAEFVGSAACAGCHPAESDLYKTSNHAATLHDFTKSDLKKAVPPEGKIPRTQMLLKSHGDAFQLARIGHEEKTLPIQLAMGSGKTGVTYVSVLEDQSLIEMRESWFPKTKSWYRTPDMRPLKPTEPGILLQGKTARLCLSCHAVTLPDNALIPEKKFYGVGCESCHGAGSTHVTAMQASSRTSIYMDRLKTWGGEKSVQLCGKCHRSVAPVTGIGAGFTNLFQAPGLMKSKCFSQSKDTLSCITCHNPHTNTEKNESVYVKACLQCHSTPTGTPTVLKPFRIVVCPVNAKEKCIGCHMPTVPVRPNTGLTTKMADHFIRKPERSLAEK